MNHNISEVKYVFKNPTSIKENLKTYVELRFLWQFCERFFI